jgi:hypothetical protein
MRCFRCVVSSFVVLTLGIAARGETPSSPLHLLPDGTDLVVQAPQPRQLVEMLLHLPTFHSAQQLAPVRELFDSTNARRFYQLVAYFEKELGVPWPQLLDRLAGRGAVVGVKFGPNPALALLVIQGDDAKFSQRFFQLALKILEQELARQEAKQALVKGTYHGVDTVRIGNEFHAAIAEGALFLSNSEKALHAGLDRLHGERKNMAENPSLLDANKLLPQKALVTFWLNMATVRQSPQAKALYQAPPRDEPALTILFGSYLDLLGRTPFVCAALHRDSDGLVTSIRLPRGRHGMGADRLLHVAPAGKPGSRPLLQPKNVLYSESNYFDLANVWKERTKLFNDKQVQLFEKFDKQSVPFLVGAKISKLLPQTAPYYRVVAVHQSDRGYKKTPKISIPAFALVWELREPEAFGKSIEAILRAAALLGGGSANLKLSEEKYKNCDLVAYRFPEDQPLKGDINDLRFNFAPCFACVGDQFVVSSTVELCRELVDLLLVEGNSPLRGEAATGRRHFYGTGAAAYLRTIEDLLRTRTALDQALTPKEARGQVTALLEAVRELGVLSLQPCFGDKTFQYDIRLSSAK